jgi:hypothetical protein
MKRVGAMSTEEEHSRGAVQLRMRDSKKIGNAYVERQVRFQCFVIHDSYF